MFRVCFWEGRAVFEISKMKDQYDGYCLTEYIRSVGLCHHKCVAGHGSNEGLTTTTKKIRKSGVEKIET